MPGERRAAAIVLVAALPFASCGGRDTAAPVAVDRDAPLVSRLTTELGAPVEWAMEGEQQRAALLAPGEIRDVVLDAPPGSRLDFALAALKGGLPRGRVALEVAGDGRTLASAEISSARSREWRPFSVPLGAPAPRRLTFRVSGLDARGNALGANRGRWLALGAPRVVTPVAPRDRKVLVWISVDTLRADHLGAYGYGRATSPVVDRLSRDGALFENMFSAAPWTLPSLTSQFTSRYPSEHGNRIERNRRDPSQKTLFQVLADEGFNVLGVTANRFVAPSFGTADGFDVLWQTDKNADEVTRLALEALSRWNGGHLALFVHYMDPHAYYDPPAPFGALFASGYRGPIDGHNFEGARRVDAAAVGHVVSLYDGEIAFTDDQVGRLLEGLGARGLLKDAVVVFSADHGEEFQEHGGWTHKRTLYQEVLHVPFALRVPGIARRRVADVVSSLDIAPTLLAALGLEAPASFQGRDLLPLLRGGTSPERGLIAETGRGRDTDPLVALRRGRFKYIAAVAPAADEPTLLREAAYDLEADPGERHPIGAPAILEPLRLEVLLYLASVRKRRPTEYASELSEEQSERLKALGYLQ